MISDELKKRFDEEIKTHPVVLYMKGNALFPMCGFSAAAYQILSAHGPVHTVDVLSDHEDRCTVALAELGVTHEATERWLLATLESLDGK